MARVRTAEEVEEIKLRERMKLSLVRQQLELNRLIGVCGCPTARGKVYITSIFQKNGMLSVSRPHLALECQIRQHLNQKDERRNRRGMFEPKIEEPEIREYCVCKTFKEKCPAFRRFIEETDSIIVKRELPADADVPTLHIETQKRETLEPVKPLPAQAPAAGAGGPAGRPAVNPYTGFGSKPKTSGSSIYQRPGAKVDPHSAHGHKSPGPSGVDNFPKPGERHRGDIRLKNRCPVPRDGAGRRDV